MSEYQKQVCSSSKDNVGFGGTWLIWNFSFASCHLFVPCQMDFWWIKKIVVGRLWAFLHSWSNLTSPKLRVRATRENTGHSITARHMGMKHGGEADREHFIAWDTIFFVQWVTVNYIYLIYPDEHAAGVSLRSVFFLVHHWFEYVNVTISVQTHLNRFYNISETFVLFHFEKQGGAASQTVSIVTK